MPTHEDQKTKTKSKMKPGACRTDRSFQPAAARPFEPYVNLGPAVRSLAASTGSAESGQTELAPALPGTTGVGSAFVRYFALVSISRPLGSDVLPPSSRSAECCHRIKDGSDFVGNRSFDLALPQAWLKGCKKLETGRPKAEASSASSVPLMS
jgi:hypothetical protein